MIKELLKNWQDKDSQMTAYFTKDTLEIIKSHTTIPSNVDIKIVPPEVVLDGKWEEDVVFIIPTNDKPLKVAFENKRGDKYE